MTEPQPVPVPAPAPKPAAPPPAAPGLGELFELSLHACVSPAVFRAAAARPAPSFAACAALVLASGAASLGVNLAHAAVAGPDLLGGHSPLLVAAVAVAALGLFASVSLLLALMLYGLGNALGGKGGFDRGVQAAAMLSVLWPLQMLCNWFPLAWMLPAAVAAWAASGALSGLFEARPAPARALCALAAAVAIGLQAAGRLALDRAREAYAATQALTQASGAGADLARQFQAFQQQADAVALAVPPPAGGAAPAPMGTSGLDLLKGRVDDSPPPAAAPSNAAEIPQALQKAQEVQNGALGMLDSISPMLNNPEITKNMTPAQKADMKVLQGLMADFAVQVKSGKGANDPAFAGKMKQIQQLSMQMIMAGMQSGALNTALSPAGPAVPPAAKPQGARR